ncbi:MAG: DUF5677 domain-containing protein [Acidobacteria bacterium]|nr:DUF5677 domain-containing protein [Acidobacteriota bacterium]
MQKRAKCKRRFARFSLNNEGEVELKTITIGRANVTIGQHARYFILLTLQARACLVAQEIYTLLQVGLTDGAHARCRTLYETTVITTIIANDFDCTLSDRIQAAAMSEHRKYLAAYNPSEEESESFRAISELVDEYVAQSQGTFGNLTRAYEWTRPLFPEKKSNDRIFFSDLEDCIGVDYMRSAHIAMLIS